MSQHNSLVYQDDQGSCRQEYQLFKVPVSNNKVKNLHENVNHYTKSSAKKNISAQLNIALSDIVHLRCKILNSWGTNKKHEPKPSS